MMNDFKAFRCVHVSLDSMCVFYFSHSLYRTIQTFLINTNWIHHSPVIKYVNQYMILSCSVFYCSELVFGMGWWFEFLELIRCCYASTWSIENVVDMFQTYLLGRKSSNELLDKIIRILLRHKNDSNLFKITLVLLSSRHNITPFQPKTEIQKKSIDS